MYYLIIILFKIYDEYYIQIIFTPFIHFVIVFRKNIEYFITFQRHTHFSVAIEPVQHETRETRHTTKYWIAGTALSGIFCGLAASLANSVGSRPSYILPVPSRPALFTHIPRYSRVTILFTFRLRAYTNLSSFARDLHANLNVT